MHKVHNSAQLARSWIPDPSKQTIASKRLIANWVRSASRRPHYVVPQAGGTIVTHTDGTFTIAGLAAAQYIICARGTLPIHVPSCAWNTADHRVSVASGQSQTGLRLSVTRGSLLAITILDSSGCVARNSKAPVYAFVGSLSQQTRKISSGAGTYHYQVVVPQQVSVKVSSNHPCSFSDFNGNAIPGTGTSIPPIQGESASVTMTAK